MGSGRSAFDRQASASVEFVGKSFLLLGRELCDESGNGFADGIVESFIAGGSERPRLLGFTLFEHTAAVFSEVGFVGDAAFDTLAGDWAVVRSVIRADHGRDNLAVHGEATLRAVFSAIELGNLLDDVLPASADRAFVGVDGHDQAFWVDEGRRRQQQAAV